MLSQTSENWQLRPKQRYTTGVEERNLTQKNEADRNLLQRVVAQDRDAFRELYLAYHRRLSRFLLRLTRQPETIEEVINDTMWAVWKQAATFRYESQVSTWIMGIAYRRMLKALQKSYTPTDVVDIGDYPIAGPDRLAEDERSQWILEGMARLPLEQRLVLEFAYDLGHSCEEIADIVGCPVNTVKTRLFHARRKLREMLPFLAGESGGPQI